MRAKPGGRVEPAKGPQNSRRPSRRRNKSPLHLLTQTPTGLCGRGAPGTRPPQAFSWLFFLLGAFSPRNAPRPPPKSAPVQPPGEADLLSNHIRGCSPSSPRRHLLPVLISPSPLLTTRPLPSVPSRLLTGVIVFRKCPHTHENADTPRARSSVCFLRAVPRVHRGTRRLSTFI